MSFIATAFGFSKELALLLQREQKTKITAKTANISQLGIIS